MGAELFENREWGASAKEAFNNAVKQAEYDYGHRGYTGTIAEKTTFVMIPLEKGYSPEDIKELLVVMGDERIDDKWGDAGCIEIPPEFYTEDDKVYKEKHPLEHLYLFFGWASS